jgi:hypothetical protein
MTDRDLFGQPASPPRLPAATAVQLLTLADVDYLDQGDGAPQVGHKASLVERLIDRGWLTRTERHPDTDGGRWWLHLTPTGREQLAVSDAWDDVHGGVTAAEFVRRRYEGGAA